MERKELLLPISSMVPSFARGINILVVDHDTTSLMYLASMLEQYSYKVTTTELACVALSMIQREKDRFKLVIANINISETYNLSFLRALLKEEIPIILMSSKRSMAASWTALVEGACFFLEKPISFDDLKYVWQHAYKRSLKHILDPEIVNHGQVSQDIRIIEGGDGLQYSIISKQMEVEADQVFLQHLMMANDQRQKQGGGFKRKRSLDDDDNKNCNNGMIPSEEIGEEMDVSCNNGNVKRKRKPRIIWTPELHLKFTEAVSALGHIKARPKQILQKMNVPGLSQRQVASHLQKYKTQIQQISDNATTDVPSTTIGKPSSIYTTITGLEKINPSAARLPKLEGNDFAAAVTGKTEGGIVQVEIASGSSSNVGNAGNQEVNATAVPETPAAIASSVNQNQPLSLYADLLKLLEDEDEDEIKSGLGGEPKQADLDRYCEWLTEALMEDGQHSE